jgi:hypothetical protein
MHVKLLVSALALGLVITDPAICAQIAPTDETPMPGEPMQPADPVPAPPMPEQPQPADPVPAQPAPEPPVETPPAPSAAPAVSSAVTPEQMAPRPATEPYPLCTKTLQDSCRNPGEGPKAVKKPR